MLNIIRICLTAALGLAIAGCKSTLTPAVPEGAAAYSVLRATEDAPVPSSYELRPGDRINITVFQEPELSQEKVVIDGGGKLDIPLIGATDAAGRTATQLADEIGDKLGARYLRNPQVTVSVVETIPKIVAVEGEVNLPGIYEIRHGYTLLSALALARSPTPTAAEDEVLVFRMIDGKRAGARFDLQAIRSGLAADPLIMDGDVVVIGFSSVRGAYQDILRAAPLFNVFTQF